ncbi:type II toxin-antitoxin system RelE/ParE family toxin [Candidatus Dependentiae bacterium]|nr:type II toxin-antitoxin system RelE/ParE family toxin [Candidatus Dependentiae bacterium]MBU4386872.1 type II toxin-antitoxin system RelE/ParE family toxin [Candidatus Dependentiae bacterium]MCG2756481.1 type II toxin-antitoxin system RelE/ParE family toxin [Candidatus Dependentiae bacterium]
MIHPPCVGYTVVFADEATKDLKKIDRQTISKILDKIKLLISVNHSNLNIKKLKSKNLLYRLRVGDYRVIYSIKHEKIIIYIVAIGHRKDIYQKLDKRIL